MAQLNLNATLKQKMQEVINDCLAESPAYCVAGCPLHVNAKGYVAKIGEGDGKGAIKLIREKLPFPGMMGRVCAHPCEEACKRNEDDHQAMSIMALKRYATTFDDEKDWDLGKEDAKSQKVAVIGAGPSGAMTAYTLAQKGYKVTIFEALPVPGGMTYVGIPEYRLPRDVIQYEYSILGKLGVEIKYNTRVGADVQMADLVKNYDAVYVAVGAHKSFGLGVEGEDMEGITNAVVFLRDAALKKPISIGKRVLVIGGGNVAIDAARVAARVGGEKVYMACLEGCKDEMPAHNWEVDDAVEEGIEVLNGWGANKLFGKDGKLAEIEFKRCTCVFDESGRFNPQYCEEETKRLEVDTIIVAIGQATDSAFAKDFPELLHPNGKLKVDPVTYQTANPKIFAGGDCIGRPSIAIEAIAMGRQAAISIDRMFQGQDLTAEREKLSYESKLQRKIKDSERGTKRVHGPKIPVAARKNNFDEVELAFTPEQALQEAKRCLQCECKECMKQCFMLTDFCEYPKEMMDKIMSGCAVDPLVPYSCNMCNQCTIVCPRDFKFSDMFYEMRKELVKSGQGPLPSHKPIHMHQYLGYHPIFNVTLSDKKAGFTKRAFMPGCALPSYQPKVVGESLKYLQTVSPGTGAVLKCCGKPTSAMGMEKEFKERFATLEAQFDKLGAEEVVVACQSCYLTMKKNGKRPVTSLYQIIAEKGVPKEVRGIGKGKLVALHDSCSIREYTYIHDAVREILNQLGYKIEELEYNRANARCCGFGGMVVPVNPGLAQRVMNRRTAEVKEADLMVTYCAACRESMTKGGKPALHLLELVFRPEWATEGVPGLQGPLDNWLKRWKSKQALKSANNN